MATGGWQDKLSDIITCEICFESFGNKIPRVLSCQHVFCQQCIQSLINTAAARNPNYDNTVLCPLCRVNTEVPLGQAASLPVFFYARKVEDIIKEDVEQRHNACGLCKTDTHIARYCFQCVKGICVKCQQKHDRMFPDHKGMDVTTEKMEQMICGVHESHMEYLCTSCQKPICNLCYFSEHSDHQVYAVTYDSQQATSSVKDWLEEKLRQAKQSRTNLDHIQTEVDGNMADTHKAIKHQYNVVKEQIDQRYTSLCKDLERIHEKLNEDLKRAKSLADDACVHLERLIKEKQRLDEPIPGVAEGKLVNIKQIMLDIERHLPQTDITVKRPPSVHFVPSPQTMTIGKLSIQGRLLRNKDTSLTLTHTIDVGGIMDVCLLSSGKLVVLDGAFESYGRLSVYNEDGHKTEHYLSQKHRGDEDLRGVCTDNTDGSVYVTEWTGEDPARYLHRHKYQAGYLHRHTPRGHQWRHDKIEVCTRPWKVAVTTDKKVLLGDDKEKLHKYDISDCRHAHSIWSIKMSGQVSSVSVTRENTIVVCIWGREVCLLDTEGHRLCTLDTGHTQIKPWGVCLDVCDDIVVCDDKSKSLLLYDKKGKFIKNVLSLSCEAFQFVKLLKHKNVIVCDMYRVFVYKM